MNSIESPSELNFDEERVSSYVLKIKEILRDPKRSEDYKLQVLESRVNAAKYCELQGEDPRTYAVYHVMFGDIKDLVNLQLEGKILHEDFPANSPYGNLSLEHLVDTYSNKG